MNLKTKNNILEKHLSNSVVNLEYLNDCLDGEKEPTIKVVQIFLEQASEIMDKLKKGILNQDYSEISYTSHFFKTSFTTMGINCYKEICEIEDLSKKKKSIEKISKLLNNMMPRYIEAIDAYILLLEKLQLE